MLFSLRFGVSIGEEELGNGLVGVVASAASVVVWVRCRRNLEEGWYPDLEEEDGEGETGGEGEGNFIQRRTF